MFGDEAVVWQDDDAGCAVDEGDEEGRDPVCVEGVACHLSEGSLLVNGEGIEWVMVRYCWVGDGYAGNEDTVLMIRDEDDIPVLRRET